MNKELVIIVAVILSAWLMFAIVNKIYCSIVDYVDEREMQREYLISTTTYYCECMHKFEITGDRLRRALASNKKMKCQHCSEYICQHNDDVILGYTNVKNEFKRSSKLPLIYQGGQWR